MFVFGIDLKQIKKWLSILHSILSYQDYISNVISTYKLIKNKNKKMPLSVYLLYGQVGLNKIKFPCLHLWN